MTPWRSARLGTRAPREAAPMPRTNWLLDHPDPKDPISYRKQCFRAPLRKAEMQQPRINRQKLVSFHNRGRQHRLQSGFGIRIEPDSLLSIDSRRRAPVTLWCWSMVRTTQKKFRRRHSRSRRSCRDELVRHFHSREDRLPVCDGRATFPSEGWRVSAAAEGRTRSP